MDQPIPEAGPGSRTGGEPRPDLVRRVLDVVPGALFVLTLGALAKYAGVAPRNTDTYFHLRFGAEFLHGEWSLRHPGSVTPFATNDWLPTQWATQIAMAWTEERLGLGGVAWLAGVWLLVFATALYLVARRRSSALAAATITLVAISAVQPALSPRPQVLSYVLVLVFTVAWLGSIRDGRPRWWLVPLTWIWAMVHGMFPLAIILGLVGAISAVMEGVGQRRARLQLFLVPLLCGLAGALTPIGPSLYGAVAQVGTYSQYFSEWASPSFRHPMGYLAGSLLGLAFVLRLRRAEKTPWGAVCFLLLATGAALYSYRTLPVAVAIVVPLLAESTAPYLVTRPMSRWERVTVASALIGSVVLLACLASGVTTRSARTPDWMVDELGSMPEHTVMLNDWEWGGYLMYAYPDLDLVAHGYGDTFTAAELERNADIMAVAPGWDSLVEETGADYALLRPTSSLAYALQRQLGWTIVAREGDAVALLRAPAPT